MFNLAVINLVELNKIELFLNRGEKILQDIWLYSSVNKAI